ncbi:helix-turn-helix domain-containing protein [Leptospira kirschneri serovar Pomona]|uniref:Helix-turn-helix domain-containing protein n=1 Tax=Leptospira kirschneri serovar Pomona TaxID=561005 RepID=A0A1T1DQ76_9LEPT|nr:helix-turn-helix domain-containing protein [Leptospira kirschneri]OOV43018.1 helix-turn-helix domain-containing protein [Leptospira kirschneri serovar Pomona]
MNENQRVFRVPKDRNYTKVKNHFIDDTRLSLKATSILLLALRYPDDWKMSVKTIARLKSDKESSITSGLKELVTFGYAEYRKKRSKAGEFESGWYFFEESQKPEVQLNIKPTKNKRIENQRELFEEEKPLLDYPQPENPLLENPVTVNPNVENQPLPNTIDQRLSKQELFTQKLNTSREYSQPAKAHVEEQKQILLEIESKNEETPLLDYPQSENPVVVNPNVENQPLPNTIDQRLSKQELSSQKLNTSREYGPPAKAHVEEQSSKKVNPRFHFPDSWLINFQNYYLKEHGSEMGQPDSELKALNSLYEISNGNWNVIETKIQTLIQLRKQDSKFWCEQSLSPESISKFWSRLFERKEKQYEKNRMRNEKRNEPKYNESKNMTDKPIEIKDLDPYKCFLVWGKTKLLKQQLEFYEQNPDPLKYEGTKKILFEKFVNEVYPGLVSNSEVKKSTIENRKENTQGIVA